MEIRRFGERNRPEKALPNCTNVFGTLIYSDANVHAVELSFEREAELYEHAASHPILFVVMTGQGHVRVGEEEAMVSAGEAVLWPPNVLHRARTMGSTMTAIAFEYGLEQEGELTEE